MKTHLVLFTCLLLSLACFGQKIKVKKNIVWRDNLPVLRIENVNVQRPKFKAEKAIISIDNDTVAWLSKNFAYIPKANYEYEEPMISYYEFELNGIDSFITYVYDKQDDFYINLAKLDLLDEDSLNASRWNSFRYDYGFNLAGVEIFSKALQAREALFAKETYAKYIEKNTSRNPNAEL